MTKQNRLKKKRKEGRAKYLEINLIKVWPYVYGEKLKMY